MCIQPEKSVWGSVGVCGCVRACMCVCILTIYEVAKITNLLCATQIDLYKMKISMPCWKISEGT